MNQLPFLAKYSGQSTDELLVLEGSFRVDSLVLAFEQGLDQKAAALGEDSLSATETLVLAVEELEREVNNGGYEQFFRNSSVQYAPIIVACLEAIGCATTSALTGKAIAALGLSATPNMEDIQRALEGSDDARDSSLDECSQCYYASGEDVAAALFSYIKSHRQEVVLP